MSEYTKGPWKLVEEAWPNQRTIVAQDGQPEIGQIIGVANARRIVACVNALEGGEDPESWIKLLQAENERLREALEPLVALYDDDIGMEAFPAATQVGCKSTTLNVIRKARLALGKEQRMKEFFVMIVPDDAYIKTRLM